MIVVIINLAVTILRINGLKEIMYHDALIVFKEKLNVMNVEESLGMHMQVHRPRDISCPVCGETRFRSGANAVQHVESGFCSGCTGKDNARQQIYNYASNRHETRGLLSHHPMLENGSSSNNVPDLAYQCPECHKMYRNLSQLMQHQDQKHNNRISLNRITNY